MVSTIFGFVQGQPKKKIQPSLLDPSTSPQVHTQRNSPSCLENHCSLSYRSEGGGLLGRWPVVLGFQRIFLLRALKYHVNLILLMTYNLGERISTAHF